MMRHVWLLALVIVGQLRADCAVPFETPSTYPVGGHTQAIAFANINSDAYRDAVIGRSDDNGNGGIAILLGNENSTFSAPTVTRRELDVSSVAAADFDRDGDDDVAASDGFHTYVFRNDNGSLSESVVTATEDVFFAQIVTGDFNGDSFGDIAVVNSQTTIKILSGDGRGSFVERSFDVGAPIRGTAAADDLDADGRTDLVYARDTGKSIAILLADANGGFQPAVEQPTERLPDRVFIADADGNGKKDVFVTSHEVTTIYLIVNPATESATSIKLTPTQLVSRGVITVKDLDRDGDSDLLIVAAGHIRTAFGTGTSFAYGPAYIPLGSAGSAIEVIAAEDLDDDGAPEMIVPTSSGVEVLRNDGTGRYLSPTWIGPANAVADFDDDGRDDVLVGERAWLSANGTPSLDESGYVRRGQRPVVGDWNGDGHLDFVYAIRSFVDSTLTTGLGNGDGTFRVSAKALPGFRVETMRPITADIDGDQKLDLIVAAVDGIFVARGNGDGTFGPFIDQQLAQPILFLSSGDFNGDGRPDLLFDRSGSPPHTAIALNQGNGIFAAPNDVALVTSIGARAVDLSGDGRDEILLAGDAPSARLRVLINRGDATFLPEEVYPVVAGEGGPPEVGDVNGDGRVDVIFVESNETTGALARGAVLLGDGTGRFRRTVSVTTVGSGSVFAGNFDGNTRTDLLDGGFIRRSTCDPRRRAVH